jgi:cytochrome c oxidase subunit I+III
VSTYFYLRSKADHWPPNLPPPDLLWGSLNALGLLISAVPNYLVKRAAEAEQSTRTRIWLIVTLGFGLAFLPIRWLEFGALHCQWDTNAYGSIVWTLLGLHTLHIMTDVADSVVLAVLILVRPIDGHRFSDVTDNALYWYFVIWSWLPIYAVIYLVPRLL